MLTFVGSFVLARGNYFLAGGYLSALCLLSVSTFCGNFLSICCRCTLHIDGAKSYVIRNDFVFRFILLPTKPNIACHLFSKGDALFNISLQS